MPRITSIWFFRVLVRSVLAALLSIVLVVATPMSNAALSGRVAVSADGNVHDLDDICATPLTLAILSKSGNASKLVYYGYNDHYWQSDASREAKMKISAENTATIWSGFNRNVFFSVTANKSAAVNALTAAINSSTASNPLIIIGAGPMQVIGLALAQSNPASRPFVTVVSHSGWNDVHAPSFGGSEGLSGTHYSFSMLGTLGAKLVHIQGQNPGLSRPYSEFNWLRDSQDSRLTWLWDRGQAAGKSTFDCSDSGMAYFLVTGDEGGTAAKYRALLEGGTPTPTPSPSATPTPSPTATPTPSPSPSATTTPTPTATPTPSPTATPTASPTPSATPTPSPSPTPEPSPTASPSPSPLPSATPTPTPSPTPEPSPTSTPTPSPTPSETPTPSPLPSPSPEPKQSVSRFMLIDADTDQAVPGYQALPDGVMIDFATLSNRRLNIRARTNSSKVGSVRFSLDGNTIESVDNSSPFSLFADRGSINALRPGMHTLTATPFSESSAEGIRGASLTISFIIQQRAPSPAPTATPSPSSTPGQTLVPNLRNVSARAYVGTGEKQSISGFIIAGEVSKRVVIRAGGPSLTGFGIADALADPMIELYDATGALIASNDNWADSQASLFGADGPYNLYQPINDLEPAITIELPPGSYSAIVHGKGGSTGLALTEVYDVTDDSESRLVNISTRAMVAAGDRVFIGGFVASGENESAVILRALGPSLVSYGLAPVLSDPELALFDENGDLVGFNEDWQDDSEQADQLIRSGLSPNYPSESAMVVHPAPGNYTAVVRGRNDATGIALFEAYDVR